MREASCISGLYHLGFAIEKPPEKLSPLKLMSAFIPRVIVAQFSNFHVVFTIGFKKLGTFPNFVRGGVDEVLRGEPLCPPRWDKGIKLAQ